MGQSNLEAHSFIQWRVKDPLKVNGVMVASDKKLEWMLPWWWTRFKATNDLPIAFVDFGMSPEARAWCQSRGQLISFDTSMDFVVPDEEISKDLKEKWNSIYLVNNFWKARRFWIQKPFAMLLTPFENTLWVDIDCEFMKNIAPIYEFLDDLGFAVCPEPDFTNEMNQAKGLSQPKQKIFNAGVILYRHGNRLMLDWAKTLVDKNGLFPGDTGTLSELLFVNKIQVKELPPIYNWRMAVGENPEAAIIHWVADYGKRHIFEEARKFFIFAPEWATPRYGI